MPKIGASARTCFLCIRTGLRPVMKYLSFMYKTAGLLNDFPGYMLPLMAMIKMVAVFIK
jgi:hypothetical protein